MTGLTLDRRLHVNSARIAAAWISLCVWAVVGSASDHIRFERIGNEVGLSHNSVFCLLQDRQGFLWLGTADGLNRFDGRECAVWRHDPEDPESLVSSFVQTLLEDQHGELWVGTAKGLDRFDRGTGRFIHELSVGAGDPAADPNVQTLYESREGEIWVGLVDGVLRRDPAGGWVEGFYHDATDHTSIAEGNVVGIQQDRKGTMWVQTATWGGASSVLNRIHEPGRFERYRAPAGWDRCGGFVIDESGLFWINVAGVGTFDPQTEEYSERLFQLARPALAKPFIDQQSRVWMPVQDGLDLIDPTAVRKTTLYLSENGDFLSHLAMAVLEDSAGTIWVGTRGGLFKWDPHRKPMVNLQHQKGDACSLGGDQVSAVFEGDSGAVWVGTYGGGLSRLDSSDGCISTFRNDPADPSSLCHDVIWDIAEDHPTGLWIGTEKGLCRYVRETDSFSLIDDFALPASEGHFNRITAVVEDSHQTLWLGSSFGLLRYDVRDGRSERFEMVEGEPYRISVHRLKLTDDTVLWMGGVARVPVLHRLDIDTGEISENLLISGVTRPSGDGVFDFHQDPSGTLWVATSGGLARLDSGRSRLDLLTTRDGLPGSVVFSILQDSNARLWLGTNRGLSRFDPQAETAARFRNFGLADGVGSIEFNRHAALAASDGRFYFGGMEGLTLFSPQEIHDNPNTPPVALVGIRVWGRGGPRQLEPHGLDHLALSHIESSLEIRFAALNFTNSEHNRFRYRLRGQDNHWIESGTVNTARYSHLEPGRYHFEVVASNNDGLWGHEAAVLAISIAPPFWKSWWGRTLFVALLGALIVAAHRRRVNRLLEVERLRWRIAGDLHDDLSSDLSGVALAAALLRRQAAPRSAAEERLAEIESTSRGMVDRLRDVVWCVNPEHDTLEAVLRRMRSVLATLLPEMPIDLELDVPPHELGLTMAQRRGLFLIFKEAIHNVARHSRAHRVTIRLQASARTLVLEIVDDGVGFDLDDSGGGEGLASMRRRAETMAGQLTVISEPGAGCTILLTADMASSRSRQRRRQAIR